MVPAKEKYKIPRREKDRHGEVVVLLRHSTANEWQPEEQADNYMTVYSKTKNSGRKTRLESSRSKDEKRGEGGPGRRGDLKRGVAC
jgi:hypothetical protein